MDGNWSTRVFKGRWRRCAYQKKKGKSVTYQCIFKGKWGNEPGCWEIGVW